LPVSVLKVRVLNACHHSHEQTFLASYSAEGDLQEKMPCVIIEVVMTEAGLSRGCPRDVWCVLKLWL